MTLDALKHFHIVYLASPYSKYTQGLDKAFEDISNIAGRMVQSGVSVYSPIAHTHPLAKYGNLDPLDHTLWLKFDEAMMRVSNALVIATMPGWRNSTGIEYEIAFFREKGKAAYTVDPGSLNVEPLEISFRYANLGTMVTDNARQKTGY
jgi:hypothetical protein